MQWVLQHLGWDLGLHWDRGVLVEQGGSAPSRRWLLQLSSHHLPKVLSVFCNCQTAWCGVRTVSPC